MMQPDVLRIALAALVTLGTVGCTPLLSPASQPAAETLTPITVSAQPRSLPPEIAHLANRPDDVWGRIAHNLRWRTEHPLVSRERDHILAQAEFFDTLSERARPVLPWIAGEIEARGLPLELALIPVIESMLDPWAYSSRHSAGLWQINPITARHYDLESNWWYDARYDIATATEVALDYLTELHQAFDGDWELALAAYNSGRSRVSRAIERARAKGAPTDYWSLELPTETRRYVPRILALSQILRRPERYGVELPIIDWNTDITAVHTGGQIELERAADLAGMEVGELRRMNPGHLRWATAPEHPGVLWLPEDRVDTFLSELAELPPGQRVRLSRYTIVPGDNLIGIARRFDTRVQLIRAVNNLNGNFIRAGDTLLIPKGGRWRDSLALASVPEPGRPARYRVRRGDSLWRIARKFDVAVDSLLRWNNLSADGYLQPGQQLKLTP